MIINTSSQKIYQCHAQKLFRYFSDFKKYSDYVPYTHYQHVVQRGHQWLIKNMKIAKNNKKYFTKSVILFDLKHLRFKGMQLEGKFPGMQWDLRVIKMSKEISKVISSHQIDLEMANLVSRKKILKTKSQLKSIEKELLLSMQKMISEKEKSNDRK